MSETKTTNEINDDSQLPPPTYNSVLQKLSAETLNSSAAITEPPNYSDINFNSVVYINNYPGPPSGEATVQIITYPEPNVVEQSVVSTVANKRIRRFLCCNGFVITILGVIAIILQIVLIVSHSPVYYYLGFWAGALIISLGISTCVLNNRHATENLRKLFRSFIWQGLFIAVVFIIGLIIILTDTCRKNRPTLTSASAHCYFSDEIVNAFILSIIGLVLLLMIIILIVIGIARRRYPST